MAPVISATKPVGGWVFNDDCGSDLKRVLIKRTRKTRRLYF